MGPTEAEGEPLVTDGSGHAVTGPEDPLASFLETVQGMVHESPSATVSASSMTTGANSRRERRAARRAAKQARKHEQKLVREERRSARSRRRRPETTQPAARPAVEPTPVVEAGTPSAAQQRVPAQADEQRRASAGRRAGRRERRQEAARAAAVPTTDPTTELAGDLEPSDDGEEQRSEVPVEAGLAGIRFTAADPVPARPSRGARRLDRRREAARAVAASVPTAEPVEPAAEPVAEPPGGSRGAADPAPVAPEGPAAGGGGEPEPPAEGDAAGDDPAGDDPQDLQNSDAGTAPPHPDDTRPAEKPDEADLDRRGRRRLRRQAKAEEKARRAQEKADAKARAKARKADAEVQRILARVERARAKAEAQAAREAPKTEPRDGGDALAVTSPAPGPDPGTVAVLSRRERRAEQALARKVAEAARLGESAHRPAEPEDLADYVARVQAPRLPRRSRRSRPRTPWWFRRTAKIAAVVVLVAACATLPWAAPQVPDLIAGVLPGHGTKPVRVDDPPVAPPKDAIVGPVGVGQASGPYDGVRLQAAGWPRQVEVQRLHVDSQVVPISGQSGSLLPPSDPQVLGWWKEGRPVGAQYGTAVITGHTVHTGGGALDHLDQLVVGDTVRVRTDAGWIRYVVQRTQIYSTQRLANEATDIFRLGGSGRLVLITCDDWDGKEYRSNAIVVATPVLDEPAAS